MSKPIIWAECTIKIGKCGNNGELATTRESIGDIEKSTTSMATNEGDVIKLQKTGGRVVDMVAEEGSTYIETTVIDPTTLYTTLGIATTANSKTRIKSLVVEGNYSMELIPKRIGGSCVLAPCTQVTILPQGEEAKGNGAKLRFTFLPGKETVDGKTEEFICDIYPLAAS